LRYASVDLSEVSVSGGRSSTNTMSRQPFSTASAWSRRSAMPAPQIKTSAVRDIGAPRVARFRSD
jgi:hypothetical protein